MTKATTQLLDQELQKLFSSKQSRSPRLDEWFSRVKQEGKDAETERDGRGKYFKLRTHWSWFIFAFILLLIVFQITLSFFIGFGLVNFEKYQNLLLLIIGENFFQIIGLGYIAVNYLFSDSRPRQRE